MPERYVLEFEEPLRQIREKIREIEAWSDHDPDHAKLEIKRLVLQEKKLAREIYDNLTNWQRVQIARHPGRPYTLDYIEALTEDFVELHGDRFAGDDPAMVAGMGKFEGIPAAGAIIEYLNETYYKFPKP